MLDWLELLDLISWTGAQRSCQGCIGFMLRFFLRVQTLMLVVWIWEKRTEVLDVCRAPGRRLDPCENVFCTAPG